MPASATIDLLAELQVRRKFYIGTVNKQTNAIKALVRRALDWKRDQVEEDRKKLNARAASIVTAALAGKDQKQEDSEIFAGLAFDLGVVAKTIEPCTNARHQIELEMKRAVRSLAVYEWAKGVRGFGELGLAVIVGEAGDLTNYPKKGHLWKRFGLAPYNGRAYSTWRMKGGLTADEWTEAGYSPRRRAEMYAVIAEPLIKAKGPYRDVYLERLAVEHGKAVAEGLIPATTGKATVESWAKRGLPPLTLVKKIEDGKHRSAGHIDFRANHYMTKRLLRDLWQAWKAGA